MRVRFWRSVVAAGLLVATMVIPASLGEDELRVWVVPSKFVYSAGEQVPFRIHVRNVGPQETRIVFSNSCVTEFEIDDPRVGLVYQSRGHVACLMGITTVVLAPGETQVFGGTWPGTTDDGDPVRGPAVLLIVGSLGPHVAPAMPVIHM